MNMSPDWVIAWALALGAVSFAVVAIIRLKTLIGGKDPDRSSNPQIDAVVDSLRLEIDDLRADHDHPTDRAAGASRLHRETVDQRPRRMARQPRSRRTKVEDRT